MNCKICGSATALSFTARVLGSYKGKYYSCDQCGFLQVDGHEWLPAAYQSPINMTDTGLVKRNLQLSKAAAVAIYYLFEKESLFLDYGGGYGLLTRLMRDMGFELYWYDPHAENLVAKGFEYRESLGKPELVTAFEVFEHFVDPLSEIRKILTYSNNILFSTELLPQPLPDPREWAYYGFEHGQHVAFYRPETLSYIAQAFKLRYYSSGFIHLFTRDLHLKSRQTFVDKVLRRVDTRYSLRSKPLRGWLRRDFRALMRGAEVLSDRVIIGKLVSKTASDAELLKAASGAT